MVDIGESEMSVSRRGGQSGKTGHYRNNKTGFINGKPVGRSCKPIVLVCTWLNRVVSVACCFPVVFIYYVSVLFSLKKTPRSNSLLLIL